ncbi:hypothetical protein CF65_03009 [Aggregatibacter actinomycetemcomitans HK1651]|nr:hypothetical protein CF65_03009 [Aggregatibacter actinomycetemcomitans HK1651]
MGITLTFLYAEWIRRHTQSAVEKTPEISTALLPYLPIQNELKIFVSKSSEVN